MGPIEVTGENYTAAISLADIPVAVLAAAGDTAAGNRLLRRAEAVSKKLADQVLVVTIDTTREPKVASGLELDHKPTVLVMNSGYILARSKGDQGAENITRFVTDTLGKANITGGVRKKKGFFNWLMDF